MAICRLSISLLLVCACTRAEPAPPAGRSETAVAERARDADRSAGAEPGGPAAGHACPDGTAMLDGGAFTSRRGHQASVSRFCLDRTEVTVAAYRACVDGGACAEPENEPSAECNWRESREREGHPMNCVTALEADVYCKAQGKRLPAADELEWAQRGGVAGTTYPWGNDADPGRLCPDTGKNDDVAHAPVTCVVGACPAGQSPQGIQDLVGNVAEWTATTTAGSADRFICGGVTTCEAGSTSAVSDSHRAGECTTQEPQLYFEGVGFRCALSR